MNFDLGSYRSRTGMVATLLVAAITACATQQPATSQGTQQPTAVARPTRLVFPGAQWQRIDRPETVGWSAAGLDRVRAKLATMNTDGFVAVVGGRVLMDYGDVQRLSYLASVRKSVLSMLYGIYVKQGRINLSKTLEQLGMDDLQGLKPLEKKATVLNLLTARSGIYHPASNAGDDTGSAPARGTQQPGTYFLYNNWDFNALGGIFEKETGIDIYDALERDIARPIGMQDFKRAEQRKSGNLATSKYPAYHMYLSTRDMARIGYLMLREGNWNGVQVVPLDWVRESTRAFTRRTAMNPARHRTGEFGYGYLWWVFDNPALPGVYEGAYTGLGAVGQQILVMPKLDLVIAHKTVPGDNAHQVTHDQFLELLKVLVDARTAK